MITILSPAKNLRSFRPEGISVSTPVFQRQAEELAGKIQKLSSWELERAMKISPALAFQTYAAYQDFFSSGEDSLIPALAGYHGLQYQNLGAQDFQLEDWEYAQEHLRILSGFYGILRPLDGIRPYRLEMQARLPDPPNLYGYWGESLYRELFRSGQTVLNAASEEYAKAVRPYLRTGDRMVTCSFLSSGKKGMRTPATLAKMARGRLARYSILNRIDSPEGLRGFQWNGFSYQPGLSSETVMAFVQ